MPRKSSTNTRALSTRISNIQKEINPYIHLKGGTASGTAKSVYIDRVTQGEFLMVSGAKTISDSDLAGIIPDGAKILSMRVSNINGRKIFVQIPIVTALILNGGDSSAPNIAIDHTAYAPLNRFPVIKVDIPDLVARNIDTGASVTGTLFKLATDGATDRVVIRFHYKQAI